MPVVKGPNGVNLQVSDEIADALLKSDGYEVVKPVVKAKAVDSDKK